MRSASVFHESQMITRVLLLGLGTWLKSIHDLEGIPSPWTRNANVPGRMHFCRYLVLNTTCEKVGDGRISAIIGDRFVSSSDHALTRTTNKTYTGERMPMPADGLPILPRTHRLNYFLVVATGLDIDKSEKTLAR